MEKKKGFFEGSFGKFVLPGIILQSVMIGGGYATGREIVEYGAKYGALGWLSGLGTFLGFAVIAALTYDSTDKGIRFQNIYENHRRALVDCIRYRLSAVYGCYHCCYGICNR